MDQGLLPRRYAKALYKFALESKSEERVYLLMKNLWASFMRESTLGQVVANPFVEDAEKQKLIMTAAGATAEDTSFVDFLKLLAMNGRMAFTREIALAYINTYRAEKHIYKVEVVTAGTMDSEVDARLKALIEKHLHGATMEYTERVDSDLIGGFVVNIDNEQLDASVSNELKQLRLKLLSK